MNLFILPFAGAGKHSYKFFVDAMSPEIHCHPVELAGRGTRIMEEPLTDIHEIVDDILARIENQLMEPYAIYGHSMGSLLAYLLTLRIIISGLRPPTHLFLTGRGGPMCKYSDYDIHKLGPTEFQQEIVSLGGMSNDIMARPELLNFLEPIMRADLAAVETYKYQPAQVISIGITVGIGKEDKVRLEQAKLWGEVTSLPLEIIEFNGGHFFIFDCVSKLTEVIAKKLLHTRVHDGIMQSRTSG